MARRQLWAITGDRSTEFSVTWQELLDLATRPDIPAGKGMCVISVRDVTGQPGWKDTPLPEQEWVESCQTYDRVAGLTHKRRLGRWGPSPLGLVYELFRLDPAELVKAPRDPPEGCPLATDL